MKFLIVGASGLIGNALYEEALKRKHSVYGTYFSYPSSGLCKLDYSDADQLKKIINDFKPEYILCPAGKTNVDWIENNPKESWDINVTKLNVLFEIAAVCGIPVVFYSTDYIFDGMDGPYSEEVIANPINFYGQLKLVGEAMLKTYFPSNYLIIRTTWVFGQEKQEKNFLYSVLKNLTQNNKMKVPLDIISTPTYVEDIAKCTLDLIKNGCTGTFNVTSSPAISKFQFADEIAKVFNLNVSLLKSVKYVTLGLPIKRPLRAGLKTDKITKAINCTWTPLEVALKEVKKEIEKDKKLVYELK